MCTSSCVRVLLLGLLLLLLAHHTLLLLVLLQSPLCRSGSSCLWLRWRRQAACRG
jgi:hypothetical protein